MIQNLPEDNYFYEDQMNNFALFKTPLQYENPNYASGDNFFYEHNEFSNYPDLCDDFRPQYQNETSLDDNMKFSTAFQTDKKWENFGDDYVEDMDHNPQYDDYDKPYYEYNKGIFPKTSEFPKDYPGKNEDYKSDPTIVNNLSKDSIEAIGQKIMEILMNPKGTSLKASNLSKLIGVKSSQNSIKKFKVTHVCNKKSNIMSRPVFKFIREKN